MTPKEPRTLQEGDYIMSANGSPVTNPWKGQPRATEEPALSYQMPGQYNLGALTDEEDDENELPDVEEMERRLLAKSGRGAAATSTKASSKAKRMSTIRIRQSISQSSSIGPQQSTDPADPFALPSVHQTPRPLYPNHLFKSHLSDSSPGISNRGAMIRVTTQAGLTIDFDPLSDDPSRVQEELIRNGVAESTRLQVRQEMAKRIRELQERLASWKI